MVPTAIIAILLLINETKEKEFSLLFWFVQSRNGRQLHWNL